MRVEPLAPFVCPLDGAELRDAAGGLGCDHGHRYDRAREGYVNLLPVQHKASRDPGDDKAMVAARRRCADAGHFAPLHDALFEWLPAMPARDRLRVLDAGCGEGHVLAALQARAVAAPAALILALGGYDISKWAVRAAARRGGATSLAVASNRQPPFAAHSVDVLLSLFGFAHWPAFAALLAAGGHLVSVDADADHLLELRELIYPEVTAGTGEPPHEAVQLGWRVNRSRQLRYRIHLDTAAAIQDLVAMTPHVHRMSADGRAALAKCARLVVTMSMVMREWSPPPLS
ncbi:MAG: methyltransferase domain-containing protein [Proteobacteria bacterium]|nr:methyltransferase domain-containing protein [Pseudomonadota bacterium]